MKDHNPSQLICWIVFALILTVAGFATLGNNTTPPQNQPVTDKLASITRNTSSDVRKFAYHSPAGDVVIGYFHSAICPDKPSMCFYLSIDYGNGLPTDYIMVPQSSVNSGIRAIRDVENTRNLFVISTKVIYETDQSYEVEPVDGGYFIDNVCWRDCRYMPTKTPELHNSSSGVFIQENNSISFQIQEV